MARRIYLMRHAKSSWKEPLPDHDRPLNRRGKRAAKLIGKALAERGIRPGLILSSSAKRARATAKRLRRALGLPTVPLATEPRLYGADAEEILGVIRRLDDGVDGVVLIGHNPSLSDAAVLLSGNERFDWLPTGALIGLSFDVDRWENVSPGKGEVFLELRPRELEGERE
jgi:phosphohistidine phosphatase